MELPGRKHTTVIIYFAVEAENHPRFLFLYSHGQSGMSRPTILLLASATFTLPSSSDRNTLTYNVRSKSVKFCGHEHIYFDENIVL